MGGGHGQEPDSSTLGALYCYSTHTTTLLPRLLLLPGGTAGGGHGPEPGSIISDRTWHECYMA